MRPSVMVILHKSLILAFGMFGGISKNDSDLLILDITLLSLTSLMDYW